VLVSIRGFAPLLQVFDMSASVAFYRDIIGFVVVNMSGKDVADSDWIMLKLGDSLLMLNTAYEREHRPPAPDPLRVKWHDDTALYFGCDNADEVYAHLCAKGWKADPPKDAYYGMRQVYTRDPDGFNVCFQHPVQK
jgi:catechol 2,3-dioxygenase-like lactoylglutathione lyase family enzyme